ncbi:Serine/threonine-protein kinase PrkC [Thalassoglobus neptunius]|uniref:non-specific serine/threonine protein kinase n=1 Tax=Thalassoglobus neptunius TaxID=1938619 RepID=A0A5C5WXZ5_9PLAN|nr:serine/threonine-protein kinase [Thalassoglobus neptunius]TWT55834.1 Serine/threonine-protein kinase PrkC [Thalassoglobus neptunius]
MSSDSQNPKPRISGWINTDLKALGKYDITRCLGVGGMGTVFLATDRELNRTVALKVLSKERAENAILVRRFKSEGQAAALLSHPNMVGVYEAGEADGFFYLALEYVDGIDVHNLLRKRLVIPVKRSLAIVKQVAAALQVAHEKRLVHRDIKPANIMIARDGTVKLTDLGLARSLDNTLDTSITRDGTTVGTIDYMSPEQAADSKKTDIRSDLYSLGCTWYHMLTGHAPFPNGDLTNKLAAHAKAPPPDPRDENPDVPEAVVAVIHRLMAKQPGERYQTPTQLLDDLNSATLLMSQDSENLLAVLMEDDFEDDDESGSFVVQAEDQAELLKKKPTHTPSPTTVQRVRKERPESTEPDGSDSVAIPVPDSEEFRPPARRAHEQSKSKRPDSKPKTPTRSRPSSSSEKASPKTKPENKVARSKLPSKNTPPKAKNSPPKQPRKSSKSSSKPKSKVLPPRKKKHADASEPKQPKGSRKPKVTLNWTRLGVIAGGLLALLILIFIVVRSFDNSGEIPQTNPYGDNYDSPLNSENDPPSSPSTSDSPQLSSVDTKAPSEIDPASPSEAEGVPTVAAANDELRDRRRLPEWMNPNWKVPPLNRQATVVVRPGAHVTAESAPSLNTALQQAFRSKTTIDVSAVKRESLQPQQVTVPQTLQITSSREPPVFVVHKNSESSSEPATNRWISFSEGAVQIHGVHFFVCNSEPSTPLSLFELNSCELTLTQCRFTIIGEGAVELITTSPNAKRPNNVVFEDCMVSGENISLTGSAQSSLGISARNSVFLSESGSICSAGKTDSTRPTSTLTVVLSNCLAATRDTLFDLTGIDTTADQRSPSIRIGIERSRLENLTENPATLLNVRNWSGTPTWNLNQLHENGIDFFVTDSILGQFNFATSSESSENQHPEPVHWEAIEAPQTIDENVTASSASCLQDVQLETVTISGLVQCGLCSREPSDSRNQPIGPSAANIPVVPSKVIERELAILRIADLASEELASNTKTVKFDLNGNRKLQSFLDSNDCPNGSTVLLSGSGLVQAPPITLTNRQLTLQFQSTSETPLQVEPASGDNSQPMFHIQGGLIKFVEGDFSIPRTRGTEETAQFAMLSNGARMEIVRTNLRTRMQSTSVVPTINITNASTNASRSSPDLTIRDSMFTGSGPIIQTQDASARIAVRNSILSSGGDLFQLGPSPTPADLLIDHCTLSAARALVRIPTDESTRQWTVLMTDCVIGPPTSQSTSYALVAGTSQTGLKNQLNWFELRTAHATVPRTLVAATPPLTGDLETDWKQFWSPHNVIDVIEGPQAVLFREVSPSETRLSPASFQLMPDSLAARWGEDGTAIGATTSQIGPPQPAAETKSERKGPEPVTLPPARF